MYNKISSKQYWDICPLQHQSHLSGRWQSPWLDKGMSPWKDINIIKQEQEQYTVGENSLWILERATTTSKTGNQSVSIATSMGIQLKNVGTRRKKKKQGNVSNMTKKDTLPKTVKGNTQ